MYTSDNSIVYFVYFFINAHFIHKALSYKYKWLNKTVEGTIFHHLTSS